MPAAFDIHRYLENELKSNLLFVTDPNPLFGSTAAQKQLAHNLAVQFPASRCRVCSYLVEIIHLESSGARATASIADLDAICQSPGLP